MTVDKSHNVMYNADMIDYRKWHEDIFCQLLITESNKMKIFKDMIDKVKRI